MLSRRVIIHHNTCKKIATFLLLLSLCLVGRISAQINIYGVEHFPKSLSERGLHGLISSVETQILRLYVYVNKKMYFCP